MSGTRDSRQSVAGQQSERWDVTSDALSMWVVTHYCGYSQRTVKQTDRKWPSKILNTSSKMSRDYIGINLGVNQSLKESADFAALGNNTPGSIFNRWRSERVWVTILSYPALHWCRLDFVQSILNFLGPSIAPYVWILKLVFVNPIRDNVTSCVTFMICEWKEGIERQLHNHFTIYTCLKKNVE